MLDWFIDFMYNPPPELYHLQQLIGSILLMLTLGGLWQLGKFIRSYLKGD